MSIESWSIAERSARYKSIKWGYFVTSILLRSGKQMTGNWAPKFPRTQLDCLVVAKKQLGIFVYDRRFYHTCLSEESQATLQLNPASLWCVWSRMSVDCHCRTKFVRERTFVCCYRGSSLLQNAPLGLFRTCSCDGSGAPPTSCFFILNFTVGWLRFSKYS